MILFQLYPVRLFQALYSSFAFSLKTLKENLIFSLGTIYLMAKMLLLYQSIRNMYLVKIKSKLVFCLLETFE